MSRVPRLSSLTLIANPLSRSYKFRQASDFWYLTGFEEPDAALVLGQSPSCSPLKRTTADGRARAYGI